MNCLSACVRVSKGHKINECVCECSTLFPSLSLSTSHVDKHATTRTCFSLRFSAFPRWLLLLLFFVWRLSMSNQHQVGWLTRKYLISVGCYSSCGCFFAAECGMVGGGEGGQQVPHFIAKSKLICTWNLSNKLASSGSSQRTPAATAAAAASQMLILATPSCLESTVGFGVNFKSRQAQDRRETADDRRHSSFRLQSK